MSDPQGTWLFDVSFMNPEMNVQTMCFNDMIKNTLIPTSVSLPSYHTEITTKKWFGSEKSFPVIRTYGGDCTMNFDIRSEPSENRYTYMLTQLNAMFRAPNTSKGSASRDKIEYHPELEYAPAIENIFQAVGDSEISALKFKTVQVRLKNKTVAAEAEDTSSTCSTIYEYSNCVITDFGFNDDLDYSSEGKLTCKLTFHYDIWHIVNSGGKV